MPDLVENAKVALSTDTTDPGGGAYRTLNSLARQERSKVSKLTKGKGGTISICENLECGAPESL